MIKANENLEMVLPKNQFKLFGYEYYFNSFINLYQKDRLPNAILLSGPKGSGKATFAYHFVNSILSKGEINEYSIKDHEINKDNFSYNRIISNTHPNFFTVDNDIFNEEIKISSEYIAK